MLYLTIISALSIVLIFLSFILGLHYGSKIKNNETIELPKPIENMQARKKNKIEKAKLTQEKIIEEINLANIDSYNGTSIGQKDFPS